jgi:transcriptional regulator of acetoin/glycerol metabolism
VNHRLAPPLTPPQPFFTTPEQRLALARERYFEEGIRPSGLVSESVIQSWARCVQSHRNPAEKIVFEPVTQGRVRSALTRSRMLLQTAQSELRQLETTLAGTSCTVILTDPQGIVVHAARPSDDHGAVLMPLAGRVGVNLAEDSIGTNAPGLTAKTRLPSVVLGAEHFFGCVQVMHCAAAPIRDAEGRLAGVLDVSSESRPFGFDAAAVVGLFATAIENRLLRTQSVDHIVMHLQTSPTLLDTPMEGLVGIDATGRIAWANSAAARLLGVAQFGSELGAEHVFGLGIAALAALTRRRGTGAHRLPNGLQVWMQARMQARDGVGPILGFGSAAAAGVSMRDRTDAATMSTATAIESGATHEAAANPPGTLRHSSRHLVLRALEECQGNVSSAAQRLGVSRGLIYRHLKNG